jgi:glycogen operon protein
VNFVTAHDGFTLNDLVSYESKHNKGNGEENRDGTDDNLSRNWGVEGPTDDPKIMRRRDREIRNFLATLAFSQGVPMIAHGDEIARSQDGNNNVYAQDNEISWVNWDLDEREKGILAFAQRVFAIRRNNPALRRRYFFRGKPVESGAKEIMWLRADGKEMTDAEWHSTTSHSLGMLIRGEAADEIDERGRPIKGDTLLLIVNNREAEEHWSLPRLEIPGSWVLIVDTDRPTIVEEVVNEITMDPSSLVLFRFQPSG